MLTLKLKHRIPRRIKVYFIKIYVINSIWLHELYGTRYKKGVTKKSAVFLGMMFWSFFSCRTLVFCVIKDFKLLYSCTASSICASTHFDLFMLTWLVYDSLWLWN